MSEVYSQGVASDGPVILCDGLPMSPDMIVEVLNQSRKKIEELEVDLKKSLDYSVELTLENQRLKEAIENVEKCGHNNDCLFCARKDIVVRHALFPYEAPKALKGE